MELIVKRADQILPLSLTLGNFVKVLLDVCRKVVVNDAGEVFHQEVGHDDPHIGGYEPSSIATVALLLFVRLDRCISSAVLPAEV